MDQPTESDRALLQLIVQLTEANSGRPPTLSEIAVAAGLQSSSRANIQRQLTRLRPTYIDWTPSPRSLQVTPAGQALLGILTDIPPELDLPSPDVILPLLASGLTRMALDVSNGKPLQAEYPPAWQRGLNILAAECLLRRIDPPAHTPAALAWCRQPPESWPIRFAGPPRLLEEPLLDGDQPTEFCRELARGLPAGEAELELCEHVMARVRNEAQLRRAQGAYVAFRQYLIEHPVVDEEDRLTASFDPALGLLGHGLLEELYEPVPHTTVEDGRLRLCGFCGWTLERRQGRLHCGDDRCRVLTANFTHGTRTVPFTAGLQRVRRAIRRYVVAPGVYELTAAQRIAELGVTVDLWPDYDRYDLRIVFADGEVWAVDIKDWRFPHLLARRLDPIPVESEAAAVRTFYAVPDVRVQEKPNYLTFLQSATTRQPFTVLTISQLSQAVHDRQQVPHA